MSVSNRSDFDILDMLRSLHNTNSPNSTANDTLIESSATSMDSFVGDNGNGDSSAPCFVPPDGPPPPPPPTQVETSASGCSGFSSVTFPAEFYHRTALYPSLNTVHDDDMHDAEPESVEESTNIPPEPQAEARVPSCYSGDTGKTTVRDQHEDGDLDLMAIVAERATQTADQVDSKIRSNAHGPAVAKQDGDGDAKEETSTPASTDTATSVHTEDSTKAKAKTEQQHQHNIPKKPLDDQPNESSGVPSSSSASAPSRNSVAEDGPGAYAVASLPSELANTPPPPPATNHALEGAATTNTEPSNSADRLTEARIVLDDPLPDLEAQPFDAEEARKRMAKEAKHRNWLVFLLALLVLFCLAVVAATVGIVSGENGSSSKDTAAPLQAPTTTHSTQPSNFPSSTPTNPLDLLLQGLPNYTLESLDSMATPQWKALDWLSRHPELPHMEEWRKKQLFALATFFHAMDGGKWPKVIRDGWLLYEVSECLWFDTTFGEFNQLTGEWEEQNYYGNMTTCNEFKEYHLLDLAGLELYGYTPRIPPEMPLLTSLSILSLPRNDIEGSLADFLPAQIYRMASIDTLLLFSNSLTGSIPTELGSMTNMADLSLSENFLTGSIPSQLGLMTSMTKLFLHNNSLVDSIPSEIGQLSYMRELGLSQNMLTGSIPTESGLMTSTTKLHMHSNNLLGLIPSEMGRLTNLEFLHMEGNYLSGGIPMELASSALNGSLVALALANNSLSGTVPEDLCSLGMFDQSIGLGLSFDCNSMLCGCCWCPCPGSNYTGECQTHPFVPSEDDEEWPGLFPVPFNTSNILTVNIRTDDYPEETTMEWSAQDESGVWEILDTQSSPRARSVLSYTYEVTSNTMYRLQLSDSEDDGTCCGYGLGWFTITSSTSSFFQSDGSVVWASTGDALKSKLDVFIWIDQNGHAQRLPTPGSLG